MGNEDEIAASERELEEKKSYFLTTAELPEQAEPSAVTYSLEEEFGRARRNWSYKFYLVLLLFPVILFLLAYGVTQYIQYRDQQVEVRVTEYQDVNLKTILEEARSEEKKLALATQKLETTIQKRTTELAKIVEVSRLARAEVEASVGSAAQKNSSLLKLKQKEDKEVAAVNQRYAGELKEQGDVVNRLTRSVAAANQKVDVGVSAANEEVNNSARLYEIRLENQKRAYEKKIREITRLYNPRFRARKTRRILAARSDRSRSSQRLAPYRPEITTDGKLGERDYRRLIRRNREFNYLSRQLRRVPYQNSVPATLRKLSQFHGYVTGTYNELLKNMTTSLRTKNEYLGSYRFAFEHLTRIRPETGYVVDPRDGERILVYINQVVHDPNSRRARVFRSDDEYIGEIEFLSGERGRYARLVSLAADKKILPFDKILISYRRQEQ